MRAGNSNSFALSLMHTNDTHAHLENMAKRITAIKQVRQTKPNALLLDAGDVFSGTLYFSEFKGLADLEFMNLIRYDAMTFGNHEFDFGTGPLEKFVDGANFPFLSANVNFSQDANLSDSFNDSITATPINGKIYNGMVKVINGEKVGIFGLTTAETPSISSPGAVTFEDYLAEARNMVQQFRALGVNKIVALTHLGFMDGGGDNDVTLAKEVEGIDVIVGGHSHDKFVAPVVETTGAEPTIITQASEYSKFLGVLDVEFDLNGKVISHNGRYIDVAPLAEDAQAKQILDTKYKPAVQVVEGTVIGSTTVVLDGLRRDVRTRETNLGNLITDAMLAKAKTLNPNAVIAFQNGGGIRAAINVGDITLGEVLTTLPFGNALALMDLKGSEIKAALERSVSASHLASPSNELGAFLHVSGMKFTYDKSKPVGQRVQSVQVKEDGQNYVALDLNKMYVVATNSFTAKGGDDYLMLKAAYEEGRATEPGFVDWEMFKEFVQANPNYVATVEGRIVEAATVTSSDFSGTAQAPKTYNNNVFVDVTNVQKLENATVNGNLYLKGNSSVTLENVNVTGETVLED